ncbi:hypothetical protein B0H11DRAFT_1989200 [Mycena galericulata]|nr:hypothetical protein B0H11DRAFT_1989200 [Mycena galericulata]
MALLVPLLPLTSDALADPEKWNSDWEAHLRRSFNIFPAGPMLCFYTEVAYLSQLNLVDEALSHYSMAVNDTCGVQFDLTKDAVRFLSSDDLEAKWLRASPDLRREHLLRGMVGVCSKARNLNEARAYAPEIRLSRLRLDGKVLLDLLKSVMIDDLSFVPSTPIYVTHPGWDAFAEEQRKQNDTDVGKVALAQILLLRTKLICHVLHFTLRSFLGLDPPELFVVKEHKSVQYQKDPSAPMHKAVLEAVLGPNAASTWLKDAKNGHKERMEQRLACCSYLGCRETQPSDDSVKFSRCKPCFDTMQRQVLYCSVKCQKADWKLRHKTICGKPLDFDSVDKPVAHPVYGPDSNKGIGPPINGFKRSPALILQVTRLNQSLAADYFLNDRNNEARQINVGEGTYIQANFRTIREKAMTTGEPAPVAIIAHYMCWQFAANNLEITPTMIVEQLAREFAFDDLREAVLQMQEMQHRDPLKRPCLLRNTPPDAWRQMMAGTKYLEAVITFD